MKILPLCLAVLACVSLPAVPSADLRLSGVEGMTSTVMQEGQSSFSGLGLRTSVRSDRFIEGIEFMPALEYWRSASTVQPFGIRSERRDATFALDARYTFLREGLRPYLGGGFAIHFLTNRVNAPALGLVNAEDSVIKGGLAALGGLTFPLGDRLQNFVEVKYHHVTDFRQLKLNWGIAYGL